METIFAMIAYLVIGSFALAAVGILLISFVQTKIIGEYGIWHFQKRGFVNVYWNDLSRTDKWCFWVGLFLLLLPFIVIGLWQIFNVQQINPAGAVKPLR